MEGKCKCSGRLFQMTGAHTHTHTHTFNGPFSGTTRVSRYQKGKTNLEPEWETSKRRLNWKMAVKMEVVDALLDAQPTVSKQH